MTKALAQEIGSRGITVNAVAPGYIETDMTKVLPDEVKAKILAQVPLGRIGQPEDIASAVKFLASEEAATSPATCSPSTAGCICEGRGRTIGHR